VTPRSITIEYEGTLEMVTPTFGMPGLWHIKEQAYCERILQPVLPAHISTTSRRKSFNATLTHSLISMGGGVTTHGVLNTPLLASLTMFS
jgi:hypothetical protein